MLARPARLHQAEVLLHQPPESRERAIGIERDRDTVGPHRLGGRKAEPEPRQIGEHGPVKLRRRRPRALGKREHIGRPLREEPVAHRHLAGIDLVHHEPVGAVERQDTGQPREARVHPGTGGQSGLKHGHGGDASAAPGQGKVGKERRPRRERDGFARMRTGSWHKGRDP